MNDLPVIPGFKMVRLLGQGGMADVYEAVQENLDRPVAIKVIIPELFRDASFAARFVKEAQTAAKLSHQHILHIYDVGATANCHYIVMERLHESLKERLKRGVLSPEDALRVLRQMGQALDYAHQKGFIHRDIKPDNVMFREDGAAVLTDFGIAKAVDSSTRLTRTGMSVGTPHYMSPEQIRGFDLDGRADFYSLGVVFHEMLTGRVPYEATDTIAVCMKHVQDPIPVLTAPLSRFQPLLDKLLAKEPGSRVSSCREYDGLLEARPQRAVEPPPERTFEPTEQPRPRPAPPRQRPATQPPVEVVSPRRAGPPARNYLVPALLALLAVLVIVLLSVTGRRAEPTYPTAETSRHEPVTQSQPEDMPSAEPPVSRHWNVAAEAKARAAVAGKGGGQARSEPASNAAGEKKTGAASVSPAPRELPRIGLLDLDPGRMQEYAERLQRVIVASPPSGVNAFGQVSLQVSVDGRGRLGILEFDDQGLTVEPSWQGSDARGAIRRALNGLSLPPPRDRSLQAAILGSWRLSFKVASFGGKWILSKQ